MGAQWWRVATAAVVVVVGCAGGRSHAEAPTTSTTESLPPTTMQPTTMPPAVTPPGTTRPIPPTTSARPGLPTSAPPEAVGTFVNGRQQTVLGAKTGWHLWIEGAGGFFVVDMDTGSINHVDAPGFFGQLYAVEGGLFYWSTERRPDTRFGALEAIRATLQSPPLAIVGADVIDFRSAKRDRIWARTANGYGEFTIDGTLTNEVTERWAVGAIGDSLVVEDAGTIFLVDVVTGRARAWAIGDVTNVGRGHIVWRECTADLRCHSWVGTESNPRARAIEPTDSMCGVWYEGYHDPCDGSFSADGRFYLAADRTGVGAPDDVTLFEIDTTWKSLVHWPNRRSAANTGDYSGLVASPDGRWLLGLQGGRVTAQAIDTGEIIEFDVLKLNGGRFDASFALG